MNARVRHSLSASRGCRAKVSFADRQASFAGKYLRTASRAVEHSVWQLAHLWMTALAGMGSKGLGQPHYLPQGLKRRAEQRQSAGAAAGEAGPQKGELCRFAERADDVVRSGKRS